MPIRLFDSPGYFIITNDTPAPDEYLDLRDIGYNFIIQRSTTEAANEVSDTTLQSNAEEQIGGASQFRPLSYQEFDDNFKEIWPIGSVYMNKSDERNPEVILGFGTWERISSGHTLMGMAPVANAQSLMKFKIESASISGNTITVTLRKKQPYIYAERQHANPAYPIPGFRTFNFVPGMKINIQGIALGEGMSGSLPNGVRTITSVGSNQETLNREAPKEFGATAPFNKDSNTGEYDQNIIRFNITSTDNSGNYNISGGSDLASDNAYFTFLDNNCYGDIIGGTKRGSSNSPGEVDVTTGLNQMPTHEHGLTYDGSLAGGDLSHGGGQKYIQTSTAKTQKYSAGNGRYGFQSQSGTITIQTSVGATGKRTMNDDSSWDNGAGYSYKDHLRNYQFNRHGSRSTAITRGKEVVPYAYSESRTNIYKSTISSAGSGTTAIHENRQPFEAVHMWKRIA